MLLVVHNGSQYTPLIAKSLRRLGFCAEVCTPDALLARLQRNSPTSVASELRGVVLSGGPGSVAAHRDTHTHADTHADADTLCALLATLPLPVLGICYGAQVIASFHAHANVVAEHSAEYGAQHLTRTQAAEEDVLGKELERDGAVWMSHHDTIVCSDAGSVVPLAHTRDRHTLAAFRCDAEASGRPVVRYGLQFHPEVSHTASGAQLLECFASLVCGCERRWSATHMAERVEARARESAGGSKGDTRPVVLGVSGGVDSTVAAVVLQRTLGDRLRCVFVDTGLLRENEADDVCATLASAGVARVQRINAADRFLGALQGVDEGETKRVVIGRVFVEVFAETVRNIAPEGGGYLGQGTIYADVLESGGDGAAKIKSHHNVGGLPGELARYGFDAGLVEPLRDLFKDDVRALGAHYGIPAAVLGRHPFPGPGLAIRIMDAVTPENLALLRSADALFVRFLREHGLYDRIWQAGVYLLPGKTVGVKGDQRSVDHAVALRAVNSHDGMTATPFPFTHDHLSALATLLPNHISNINRVLYDLSTKPPASIEPL